MTWCLSWRTPSGAGEALVVVAFWAGVAATGPWAWRRLRSIRVATITADSEGDRHQAGTGTEEAPDRGARIGSTR